jgi:pimeloyl-ACP methyl ester carboxylesterase
MTAPRSEALGERVEVLGKRVEAVRAAENAGARTTLVFLHEGLGSAKQWRDLPALLAGETGLGALAYSRLGYGGSDPVPLPRPLDYMEEEARGLLPALLDALGVASAVLVGHSDGASIALVNAAIDGGVRVRALVLLAPHVFVEDVSVASIAEAKVAFEAGDLRDKLRRHHGANVDCAFRGWNDAWLDPAFRAWNLEAYLPKITVPVLVLQGEDDPYGTRAQVDAIARQVSGPCETVLLPGCGHAPQRDQPTLTREAIVAFLHRHSASLLY